MSVWAGPARSEKRSISARKDFRSYIGYLTTGGYQEATPVTMESALQSVAVGAAVDLIASIASELPSHSYMEAAVAGNRRPLPRYLLDPSGDGYGLSDWIYMLMTSWLLRGNTFGAVLDWSPSGAYRTQVDLIHPDKINGWIEGGKPTWSVDGQIVESPDVDFVHYRVNPVPGQTLGLSTIQLKATQIGVSIASNRFGLQWFRDGAHPGGMLLSDKRDLDGNDAITVKDRFMASLRGGRGPVVMAPGWRYEQIQITPEESQFLQTQNFSEAQCARIFGPAVPDILGFDTGKAMTYSNRVDRANDFLVFTLEKWLRRVERVLTGMLPAGRRVVIDRAGILASTILERYRTYALALDPETGWLTKNEVRIDDNRTPVEWGDEPPGAQKDDPPSEVIENA